MKKTYRTLLLAAAALSLAACSSNDPISNEEAMKAALKDAGLEEKDVKFTKQNYDKEDNDYEFDFHTDTVQYEYEIDGSDGKIIGKEKETYQHTDNNPTTDTSLSNDEKVFLNIALTHFQLTETEITNITVKEDMDDGIAVMDVEFYKEGTKYSCEIQKDNQQILNTDRDQD